jgi:hypothetical protein
MTPIRYNPLPDSTSDPNIPENQSNQPLSVSIVRGDEETILTTELSDHSLATHPVVMSWAGNNLDNNTPTELPPRLVTHGC